MKQAIMKLDGLTCPSCMQKIEHAVYGVNGVQDVKVLFNAAKLKTHFDSAATSADDLANVVQELGYTVKSIKVKD
ncbi:heavy-metal-associated domain-containing protein [Lacticaseibacillus zhaodongensis]|uniref:heavy-metal-associated domain-containing protein n=1 Tax=Lacticaseibacillus zhaodongensis TaxID=2668065 RepID=UPI0012D2CD0B|nr:cation transporter [Lacticaseibacillus zhaodongensis]